MGVRVRNWQYIYIYISLQQVQRYEFPRRQMIDLPLEESSRAFVLHQVGNDGNAGLG